MAAAKTKKPRAIKKPAKPDDLKKISGVGGVLESKLNSMGVYKYSQIAVWKKEEIEWVDDYLSFKGRIEPLRLIKEGGVRTFVNITGCAGPDVCIGQVGNVLMIQKGVISPVHYCKWG